MTEEKLQIYLKILNWFISIAPYSFIFSFKDSTHFVSWALGHLFCKFFYAYSNALSQEIAINSVLQIRKMYKSHPGLHLRSYN